MARDPLFRLPEREVTDPQVFLRRREFIGGALALGAAASLACAEAQPARDLANARPGRGSVPQNALSAADAVTIQCSPHVTRAPLPHASRAREALAPVATPRPGRQHLSVAWDGMRERTCF